MCPLGQKLINDDETRSSIFLRGGLSSWDKKVNFIAEGVCLCKLTKLMVLHCNRNKKNLS